MERLRHARVLARLVLAWFALSVGVAMAAPVLQPAAVQWICTGGGAAKLLLSADDGPTAPAGHTPDCPLCATPALPPPDGGRHLDPAAPGASAQGTPPAWVALRRDAPPPGRGPPARPEA